MRPVDVGEILDLKAYEASRDKIRAEILAVKEARRIAVGSNMTLLFENRDTLRYQVQEMVRVERLMKPEEIRHEVETYNELIPGKDELSATLLVEYPDDVQRDKMLRQLLGLEKNALKILVGNLPPALATFDQRQIATDRISSVHYVRFHLGAEAARAFKSQGLQGNVRIVVDHPAYQATAVLRPNQVIALAADLETP